MSASYQAIKRNGDFGVSLGNSVPVQPNAVITDDFLEVDFLLKNGTHVKEFFLQVVPRDDLLKRQATNKGPGLPLNILIICIDSLSHASARRKLPKIYDFLQHEVDAFIFNGHTIVGDGTTEQMTALLTGLKYSEQYEARSGFPNARTVDDWTWIYKQLRGRNMNIHHFLSYNRRLSRCCARIISPKDWRALGGSSTQSKRCRYGG